MAKPDRPPIFERLQPFAPWDQRAAPSLLDEPETKRRAAELGGASDRLAVALRGVDVSQMNQAVTQNLQHLAQVAEWSSGVWREAFDSEPVAGDLATLCDAAGERPDPVEAIGALARVAVPRLISAAVLLQAELGDEVTPGRERWLRLLIDELETTRADLELVVQSQLGPGDGARLADACAEVAKKVC